MAKLEKPCKPIRLRVNNEERMEELVAIYNRNNWIFFVGIEMYQEDIFLKWNTC